jgi:syntaxin-binding protein 5
VGTEKGNVYFVSVSTFTVSGYVIMWNKAIDL